MTKQEKGVEPPNYTQTPNAFFDDLLPQIKSVCELKVTLAIIRQTFGWQKGEDQLSVTQLQKLTGLSRQGVQNGLELALERGSVIRRAQGQNFFYSLKLCNNVERLQKSTMQQNSMEPCNDFARQLCNDFDPQKKVVKKKETPTEAQGAKPADSSQETSTLDASEWWRYGVRILSVEASDQKGVRSLLARQRKLHGLETVTEALRKTEAARPAEPKSYFLAVLKQQTAKEIFYTDLIASFDARREERERERREREANNNSEKSDFRNPAMRPPRAA